MSVTLSNSVRQNLLSLQSTAELLSTTQSRLSSGKKVNSALDNPTNFFTAAGLDSRASDINNLLDGIGNGVQILNAASTGITSLNKLVDSAKSIANQALQTTSGYATKSNVSTTIAGATSDDLRGTTAFDSTVASGNVIASAAAGGNTGVAITNKLGGAIGSVAASAAVNVVPAANAAATAGTALFNTTSGSLVAGTAISAIATTSGGASSGPVAGDSIVVDGKTITFGASGSATADTNGNYTIGVDQTVGSLLSTIDTINGNTTNASSVGSGAITLNTGTNRALTIADGSTGTLAKLGLTAGTTALGTGTSGNITGATKLFNTVGGLSTTAISDGTSLSVNGKTITFKALAPPTANSLATGNSGVSGNIATDGSGNSTIYLGTSSTYTSATVSDLLTAVDLASGVKSASNTAGVATITTNSSQSASAVAAGIVTLNSSTGANLNLSGPADLLKQIGLTTATGSGSVSVTAQRVTSSSTVANQIQDGSTLNVNGKTITFKNAATPAASSTHTGVSGNVETDGSGNSTVYLQSATVSDVLTAVDLATGVQTASLASTGATLKTTAGTTNSTLSAGGALKLSTGLTSDLKISGTGNALSALGLTGATGTDSSFSASRAASASGINGKTLTFSAFKGGSATSVTFGDGTNGTVKSLAQLNAQPSANNLTASVDNSTGKLTIAASNDYASSTLGQADGGAIGGNAASTLSFTSAQAPVADPTAQNTRAGLVKQFNDILTQINTTAQDASFNGVNLLGGDTLKLTFNETGKSTLNIQGVTFGATGLGLASLSAGSDFIDNSSTNKVLSTLNTASTTLRSQASALGSNLSIVQARQDFSKSLINVLQAGSSNLTLADTNEEAANSQALSTRQSIAVSALSLANTSQQSVLQLLR